jgi:adenylosuccinate synthase
VRYGWFDPVLTRYALAATGGVDLLAVTHIDALSGLDGWKYCVGYEGVSGPFASPDQSGLLTDLRATNAASLPERELFTQGLLAARPVLAACTAEEQVVIQIIQRSLARKIDFISRGPTAGDVQSVRAAPA